jgi:hypothetical protein
MLYIMGYIHKANVQKLSHVSECAADHKLWNKQRNDMVKLWINHRKLRNKGNIASSVVEPFFETFAN